MRHAAALAVIMSLAAFAARADVYRSVDPQGHVEYSDTPTPGSELVHVQKLGEANTSSLNSAPASTPSAAQSVAKSNAGVQEDLTKTAAQKAVAADVEQNRAEQCKKATTDYEQAVAARRIYKTGADGEREYLTDADADQQRLNLRLAMQSACGE
jgi:hypothetical protein